ncbi:hypothetical protein [Maribacter antarcticus]|uniref:hypothetical protein n=1 Tax=Maribacter antarcticus TaxID=505250 RepID=UPI00047D6AEC|nr:hypothetical protein [Maribacter antarcticus]
MKRIKLLSEGKMITAQAIKARYLGQDEQYKSLKELISNHNTNMDFLLEYGTMKTSILLSGICTSF